MTVAREAELPIITLYAMYIPIFVALMKQKSLSGFKRIVAPVLSILCSLFMVFATFYAYRITVVYYMVVFAVIMAVGAALKGKKKA